MIDKKFDIYLGFSYDTERDLYTHECMIPGYGILSVEGEVLLPETEDRDRLYFPDNVIIPRWHFNRVIHKHIVNSEEDLCRIQEEHPTIDIAPIKIKLDDPEIRMRYGFISLIIIDSNPVRFQKKLAEIGRSSPEDTWKKIHDYMSGDAYNIAISSNPCHLERMIFQEDIKVRYIIEDLAGAAKIYYKQDLTITKRNWSYRLYINDRLLMERPFELQLSLIKWYQEMVIFNDIPKQGYNFKLETPLNLRIMAVKVDGQRLELPAGATSFSL